MAVPTPGCCDGPNELLYKILLGLADIEGGLGGGDVVGPAGATDGDIVLFDGATGKLIKDSGVNISDIVTEDDLQAGSQAIGSGVDTISVVFPTVMTGVPVVLASMSRPAAEDLIFINIDEASITAAGFTASLSSTTGSANYRMKWMAKV